MTDVQAKPAWLTAEMPPGYRNRLEEIERLSRELDQLSRFGSLLYSVGDALSAAVKEACAALDFETVATRRPGGLSVDVKLDSARRVLFHVSASDAVIQRKSQDLAHVFQMLHEVAGADDRVVLIANHHPDTRPADRPEGIEADALNLLKRLGANYLPAPALFAIWSASLQNRDLARGSIDRLHAQDGGAFVLPAVLTV